MATQTIEFRAAPSQTVTLRLFVVGSDTQVASATATEATNRKGTYAAVFTSVAAGEYQYVATIGTSPTIPLASGYVTLALATATYQVYDAAKAVIVNDKSGYGLAADQAVNVTKVGGTAVAGPNDLKADVSGLASQSSVNQISGRIPDALENGRIKAVATVSTAGLATEATQLAILAQTSLIGQGGVSIQSPVNQTGELQTLIVGDAYQLAAGRAITISVLNVAAGLQTILSNGATVHLGFRSFGKSRQSPDFRRYEFAGTIVSVAATTVVRFELTTAQTKGILPGQYDYDIEFRQGGNYVTSVSNAEDVPMSWRESSTTLPA